MGENFKTNKWKKSFNRVAKWKQECLPPPYKFTSKDDLKTKLQAFNDDAASTEATYGPVAGWDVSGITDMSFLFSADETGAGGYWSGITNDFNADISDWDTSAVTNMRGMFQGAIEFDKPLNFDTSSVTDMRSMFDNARKFDRRLNFNTCRVTDMRWMLKDASAFNNKLSFDTSKVTNMQSMFTSASAFDQPLSFDTSKVTTMYQMFLRAHAFNQPLNFDISSVTDMDAIFAPSNSLSDANKLLIHCAWVIYSRDNQAWFHSGYPTEWTLPMNQ